MTKLIKTSSLIFAAIFSFLLLYPFPATPDVRFWSAILNFGHVPLFAFATLVIWLLAKFKWGAEKAYWISAFACGGLVLAIELFQPLFGRGAEWHDVLFGFQGILIVLVALCIYNSKLSFPWRLSYILATSICLLCGFLPIWKQWLAIEWRRAAFPLLADFEDNSQLVLWHPGSSYPEGRSGFGPTVSVARSGKRSLLIKTTQGYYNAVEFGAGSFGWSGYQELLFAAYNFNSEPFEVRVRIDDDGDCKEPSGRFTTVFKLDPGWNELSISVEDVKNGPVFRQMDIDSIRRLYFYTSKANPSGSWAIDDIRLQK